MKRSRCTACGYDLSGLEALCDPRCPECGAAVSGGDLPRPPLIPDRFLIAGVALGLALLPPLLWLQHRWHGPGLRHEAACTIRAWIYSSVCLGVLVYAKARRLGRGEGIILGVFLGTFFGFWCAGAAAAALGLKH